MGVAQSRRKRNDENALAVVASPGPMARPATPVDPNSSLNDTQQLLSEDAQWLDESEMLAMEDEDAKLVRELSATEAGDVNLDDWLKQRENDITMSVKITNVSTQSKFMGRKTVEYTIVTDTGTVKRRFRDFVAMRYGLEIRFPGAVVPPLPARKRIGKTEPNFLVKRKRFLQQFLQSLTRHPFLSGDDLFVEFIASAARFDRKAAWRPRAYLVKAQKWSIASRRWAQALIQAQTPANPQATMEAAALELVAIQKHLIGMKAVAKAIGYRSTALSNAILDLGGAFQRSQAQEAQLVVFSGAVGDPDVPADERMTLTQVFSHAQALSAQHAEVVQQTPDLVDEALVSPIRFEMSFVETFQEAIRRTRFSIVRHRQAVSTYRTAREQSEIASFRQSNVALAVQADATGASSTHLEHARLIATQSEADKQRQKLQRLRVAAVQAQMSARRDINGVLALELQRFRVERAARLARAFSAYTRVQRTEAERIESIWKQAHFPPISPVATVTPPRAETDFPTGPDAPPPPRSPSSAGQNGYGNGYPSMDQPSQIQHEEDSTMVTSRPSRRLSQLRAKYPFQGENEDELDVNEGDMLVGDEDDLNPDWIRAKSLVTGREGLVPKTYVEEVEGDEDEEGDDEDDGGPAPPPSSPDKGAGDVPPATNYIKQTQDMIKGTKRTNEEREKM